MKPRSGDTRVLVHLNNLALGGTQINGLDMADAVRRHGFTSVLMGPRDTLPESGPSLLELARERGWDIHVYDRPATSMGNAALLGRLADQHAVDIVHIYGQGTMRGAFLGPCRWGRRGLVQTAYEMSVSPYTMRGHELIVGTGYLVDDLAARGRVTLISPPVDLERDDSSVVDGPGFRKSLGLPDGAIHLVLVSRLDRVMKEPAVRAAIDALPRLGRKDVHLTIVGGGDAEEDLREAGARVNADAGMTLVRFTGPLGDPRAAYASADVTAAMGGSAARSLAFGKPLIAQGERGWAQAFMPESAKAIFRNSFWSDEYRSDPAGDFASALRVLLQARERWPELGRFGREFAVANFGLAAMSERLAAVYEAARSYGPRRWAMDLDLELRAAVHRLRHGAPAPPDNTVRESDGEYRFPPPRRAWAR